MNECLLRWFSRMLCSLHVCLFPRRSARSNSGDRHSTSSETAMAWNGHSDKNLSAFPPVLINAVSVLLFAKAWLVQNERSNSWTVGCSKKEPLHTRMKSCLPSHAKQPKRLGLVSSTPYRGASSKYSDDYSTANMQIYARLKNVLPCGDFFRRELEFQR